MKVLCLLVVALCGLIPLPCAAPLRYSIVRPSGTGIAASDNGISEEAFYYPRPRRQGILTGPAGRDGRHGRDGDPGATGDDAAYLFERRLRQIEGELRDEMDQRIEEVKRSKSRETQQVEDRLGAMGAEIGEMKLKHGVVAALGEIERKRLEDDKSKYKEVVTHMQNNLGKRVEELASAQFNYQEAVSHMQTDLRQRVEKLESDKSKYLEVVTHMKTNLGKRVEELEKLTTSYKGDFKAYEGHYKAVQKELQELPALRKQLQDFQDQLTDLQQEPLTRNIIVSGVPQIAMERVRDEVEHSEIKMIDQSLEAQAEAFLGVMKAGGDFKVGADFAVCGRNSTKGQRVLKGSFVVGSVFVILLFFISFFYLYYHKVYSKKSRTADTSPK